MHSFVHEGLGGKIEAVIDRLPAEGVRLAEIRDLFGQDGLMLLSAFLTLVFLVPVSIPGVSTVFGAAILMLGVTRLFGRNLWLPSSIENRIVPTEKIQSTMRRGMVWFRRLERLSRPNRFPWIACDGLTGVVNNCALIFGAILLMAPFGLIPFSNTFPAVALLLLAIGFIQRDGLCIFLGHCANLLTVLYFSLLIAGGGVAIYQAVQNIVTHSP
jgi:hypothetical protein